MEFCSFVILFVGGVREGKGRGGCLCTGNYLDYCIRGTHFQQRINVSSAFFVKVQIMLSYFSSSPSHNSFVA